MALTGKLILKGKIKTLTGLHIGGSKAALDIGGVDLNVIKTPLGVPYIPGSSLKGKMRSLLARLHNSKGVGKRDVDRGERFDDQIPYLRELFGTSADSVHDTLTRLLVRDCYLDVSRWEFDLNSMEFPWSDVKFENTIDRKKGSANNLRQLERVPAGAFFDFHLVYDLYEDIDVIYENKYDETWSKSLLEEVVEVATAIAGIVPGNTPIGKKTRYQKHLQAINTALSLLMDDYLGGHGSRGYGQIGFVDYTLTKKVIDVNTGEYQVANLDADAQHFFESLPKLETA